MKRTHFIIIALFCWVGWINQSSAGEAVTELSPERVRWLESELSLCGKLSTNGFRDVAQNLIAKLLKTKDLAPSERNEIDRVAANLRADAIIYILDTADKLKEAENVINQMRQISNRFRANTPARDRADADLMKMYFKIAAQFTGEVERIRARDPEAGAELDKGIAELERLAIPLRRLGAQLVTLPPNAGEAEKKRAKSISDEYESARKNLAEDRSSQTLGGAAARYYQEGMQLVQPVLDRIDWALTQAQDKLWEENVDAATKRKAMNDINTALSSKFDMYFEVENAYATWPRLYWPRSLPFQIQLKIHHKTGKLEPLEQDMNERVNRRMEILQLADRFIEQSIPDYSDYFPTNRSVYIAWLRLMAQRDDEIRRPEFDEQLSGDKENPSYYIWASSRMKFLYDKYIVNAADEESGRKIPISPEQRSLALYYFTEGYLEQAKGAYAAAKLDPDKGRAQNYLAHGDKLVKLAEEQLKQITSGNSYWTGGVTQVAKNLGQVNLLTELYFVNAQRAMTQNMPDRAKSEVEKAYQACEQFMLGSSGQLYAMARDRLNHIKAQSEVVLGGAAAEISPVAAVFNTATQALIKATRTTNAAEKNQLLRESRQAYQEVATEINKIPDRRRRAAYLAESWSRLGTIPLIAGVDAELKDLYSAFIYNAAVVYEFTEKRYPRDQFPQAADIYDRATNNMRAAANQQMNASQSPADRSLYAEALAAAVGGAANPDPNVIVDLIIQLQRLKFYREAVTYIDQVPADHRYYLLIQYMGAKIYQILYSEAVDELGKLPADASAAVKTRLENTIKNYREQAEKRAEDFITTALAQPEPQADDTGSAKIRQDNYNNIADAITIKIDNAYRAKDWANVRREMVAATRRLASKDISDKITDKNIRDLAQNRIFMRGFLALLQSVNTKDDALDKIEKAITEAGTVQKEMAKLSIVNENLADTYRYLGSMWLNLATRVRDMSASARGTEKTNLEAKYTEYRRNAGEWFENAESIIYTKLGNGLLVGGLFNTLARESEDKAQRLELYDKARGVYDKIIQFWGESLYTDNSLLQPGKTLANLKTPATTEVQSLVGSLNLGNVNDANAAIQALNNFIKNTNVGDNLAAIRTAFNNLLTKPGTNADLLANLRTTLAIIGDKGDSLQNTDQPEIRENTQYIARIITEAAWPAVLYHTPAKPALSKEAEFDAKVRSLTSPSPYISENGRSKIAAFIALLDQKDPYLAGDATRRLEQVKTRLQDKAKAESGTERARLETLVNMFDTDLKTLVYGRLDEKTGNLRGRSFYRARQQIQGIFEINKEIPSEGSEPRQIQIEDFLKAIDNALEFNAGLIDAKLNYAQALVNLEKHTDALKYLEDLVAYSPDNPELILNLAQSYSAYAVQLSTGGKYDARAAQNFMQARIKALQIIQGSPEASPLWWQGHLVYWSNDAAEAAARKSGKMSEAAEVALSFDVPTIDPQTNKMVMVKKSVDPRQRQGDTAVRELSRISRRGNAPDFFKQGAKTILDDLQKIGFAPRSARN